MGLYGDPATLTKLATALQGSAVDLGKTASDLGWTVNLMVPSSWSGGAANAFFAHWSGEQTNMVDLGLSGSTIAGTLNRLATALQQANQLAAANIPATKGVSTFNPNGPTAYGIAQAAWAQATAELSRVSVPAIGAATNPQQAQAWATSVVPAPPPGPWYQGATQWVQTAWDATSQWTQDHSKDLLNLVGDTGWMTLGTLGLIAGTGVEIGGLVLDASGAGAIVGVPANWAGAALDVASVGVFGGGAAKFGLDFRNLFSQNAQGGSGGSDPTVSQVLKTRRGSILRAPLEKGSPSWSDIMDMPMSEIRAKARQDVPGYRTILKLLTDNRFSK
jgi:uncharacterized protein YukE